jgi:membrane-associated protease RseP (regulator of RpoE activity)
VPLSPRAATIHAGLFVATCLTTWWAGGAAFAAALMTILVCHEAGHYVVGRRRGIAVSLPYFIPLPPYISLGTMGAVIRMDDAISDRRALFDVGAAGPLAGFVVAVPLLVVGLHLSEVGPLEPGAMIEGNSLLYAALKYAVHGRLLPADGIDVQLHPVAFAGWVGLLLTMVNLIPIGQLDGGHVARAALGDAHERWSARLHVALPIVGAIVGGAMVAMALAAGRSIGGALGYGAYGAAPWAMWALLLFELRRRAGEYHPPVEATPLDPGRRRSALALAIGFLLIATPVPFRPVL